MSRSIITYMCMFFSLSTNIFVSLCSYLIFRHSTCSK